jgi:hypothetical protein
MFTGAFDRPDLNEAKVLLEGLSTYLITPSALTTSSAVKVRLCQIQGVSAKRKMNWHYGVSVAARTGPIRHVRVIGRLIFTTDGHAPFEDSSRQHRLRRSFAKSWRNARWRDMLLAFLYWLGRAWHTRREPRRAGRPVEPEVGHPVYAEAFGRT